MTLILDENKQFVQVPDLKRLVQAMEAFYQGSKKDIIHFHGVHRYAKEISDREVKSAMERYCIEAAAIVHDIACPLCYQKYGHASGKVQEAESEALLRPFLKELDMPEALLERILWLVCHHHTYKPVDGMDHQILLEADYLQNGQESKPYYQAREQFRDNVFVTDTGKALLQSKIFDAPISFE